MTRAFDQTRARNLVFRRLIQCREMAARRLNIPTTFIWSQI